MPTVPKAARRNLQSDGDAPLENGEEIVLCPRCGARFNGSKEDDTEFDEEMMEEEDWDEEEDL